VSHSPDRVEEFVCRAVQQCYDMLKQVYAGRDALNRYTLEEVIPEKSLKIALECGWLPETARTDSPDWRDWSSQLLTGRFSLGLDDSCTPDPYLFVAFPNAISGVKRSNVQAVVEGPRTKPAGDNRGKPGPKTGTEEGRLVAQIVARISDGRRWQDMLYEICEALDKEKVPCPKTWRAKSINSWSEAAETTDQRELGKKAISHRLEIARRT
jgi:hypothetical protein